MRQSSPAPSGHVAEGQRIRVSIADDHAIVRRGLAQILAEACDMVLAGEAANAAELAHLLQATSCDVLLLDISLPDRSGLDVLRDVRQRFPDVRVVILSAHGEEQYAGRAREAGAAAYLPKESAPEELLQVIRHVHQRGNYIRPSQSEDAAAARRRGEGSALHEALSAREFDVLRRLAGGESVSAIALALSLSVKTVSTYRSRILAKLGLSSNAALARYAVEHRLIW